MRDRFGIQGHRRYLIITIVAVITSLLSFPMVLLNNSMDNTVNKLFSVDALNFASHTSSFAHLFLFIIIKFILSSISIIQPISSGVFMPVFACGAGVGRLVGEIASLYSIGVTPGGFSVVGAAALASGTTRTLSTSVIMFELTGQLSYMVPIMIATVTATAVGNLFNMSIYDEILTLRGLPYLTQIRDTTNVVNKSVRDLMKQRQLRVLRVNSNDHIQDIKQGTVIHLYNNIVLTSGHDSYPIVEDDMVLVGAAMRTHLNIIIGEYEYKKEHGTPSQQVAFYSGEKKEDDTTEDVLVVPIDPAPFQIHVMTPLTKAHFLFSMLGLSHAWVMSEGKLLGVLTKKDLINARL
jgi:chloride channel 2